MRTGLEETTIRRWDQAEARRRQADYAGPAAATESETTGRERRGRYAQANADAAAAAAANGGTNICRTS